MNLVGIGLSDMKILSDLNGKLPDSNMAFNFSQNERWDEGKAKNEWTHWVLLNGFRDVTESLNYLLEEINNTLAYCNLFQLQNKLGVISGVQYQELIINRTKKFHGYHFPPKIKFLKDEYDFKPDQNMATYINSIINARNCIVHRQGIVHGRDFNSGNVLEITFLELKLILKN